MNINKLISDEFDWYRRWFHYKILKVSLKRAKKFADYMSQSNNGKTFYVFDSPGTAAIVKKQNYGNERVFGNRYVVLSTKEIKQLTKGNFDYLNRQEIAVYEAKIK